MDYMSEYKSKLRTADEAAALVKSGDWVEYGTGVAFPSYCDEALAAPPRRADGRKDTRDALLRPRSAPSRATRSRSTSPITPGTSRATTASSPTAACATTSPCSTATCAGTTTTSCTSTSPSSAPRPWTSHGYFNLSIATGNARAYIDNADVVVIEVLEGLPHVYGGQEESVHISEVDMVVEGEHGPAIQLPSRAPSEADAKIAANVIPYLCDGATIQLGIGGVPDALGVMIAESDLKDLGMHTEFATDAFYKLFAAGKLTGRRKTIDTRQGRLRRRRRHPGPLRLGGRQPRRRRLPHKLCQQPRRHSPARQLHLAQQLRRHRPLRPGQLRELRHPPDKRHRRPGGLPHRRGQEQRGQGLHLHVQHLQGQGRHAKEPHLALFQRRRHQSPARAARPSTSPPSTAWPTSPAPAPGSGPKS